MVRLPKILLLFILALLVWSGIHPYDRFTWVLEVAPAVIGLIILIVLYPKFQFTNFTLCFIAFEMAILIIGGHYTYALMPLFDRFQVIFHFQRNHYDRLGHLAQGMTPALIARELLIRKDIVKKEPWLSIIVISIPLAISAIYEIIEFITAVLLGEAAHAFLGTQGDVWDTQMDMLFALIGDLLALACFSKLQNQAIDSLKKE